MGDIDLRQRGEDMPLGVTLRIVSAPASFALPMVQRKPFKPAFLVRPARRPLPAHAAALAALWCKPCFGGGSPKVWDKRLPLSKPLALRQDDSVLLHTAPAA